MTITSEFNISGIPHYMLIGKDGRIIDSDYDEYSIDYKYLKDLSGAK